MDRQPFLSRIAPALTLMVLAPLVAEVLPGATRFSSIFVFPIEVLVWGGGAVMIREITRRLHLGWASLVCLGLCLALAEEFLIQQTSAAPLVIQLKGVEWARGWGVNYVYLLWAVVYETVLVVLIPILLTELIFRKRKAQGWLSRAGAVVITLLFGAGAFLAWFTWTQIARTKVFHLPAYDLPMDVAGGAVAAIAVLAFLAIGPLRRLLPDRVKPAAPPPPWGLALLGAGWAVVWYGLTLLAFGEWPQTPPALAVAGGLAVVVAMLVVTPRFAVHPTWSDWSRYGLAFGTLGGAMGIGFIGFIWGTAPADLWFKIVVDLIAVAAMIWLGVDLRARPNSVVPAGPRPVSS